MTWRWVGAGLGGGVGKGQGSQTDESSAEIVDRGRHEGVCAAVFAQIDCREGREGEREFAAAADDDVVNLKKKKAHIPSCQSSVTCNLRST